MYLREEVITFRTGKWYAQPSSEMLPDRTEGVLWDFIQPIAILDTIPLGCSLWYYKPRQEVCSSLFFPFCLVGDQRLVHSSQHPQCRRMQLFSYCECSPKTLVPFYCGFSWTSLNVVRKWEQIHTPTTRNYVESKGPRTIHPWMVVCLHQISLIRAQATLSEQKSKKPEEMGHEGKKFLYIN